MTNVSKKRGQMKLSFGMIFSIILIVIFIAFAFYGIQKFLSLQNNINTKQFIDNLQSDVTQAWRSPQTSMTKSYDLPSSISKVCFEKTAGDNLVFIDNKGNSNIGGQIDYLNITSESCFNTKDGKVSLTIKKSLKGTLVTIS